MKAQGGIAPFAPDIQRGGGPHFGGGGGGGGGGGFPKSCL